MEYNMMHRRVHTQEHEHELIEGKLKDVIEMPVGVGPVSTQEHELEIRNRVSNVTNRGTL